MARGPDYWRNRARMYARQAGINPDIYEKQIKQESGFNPRAQSPAGAKGIAQIVPRWHPGVNPMDPEASLRYSANLMAKLYKKYGNYQDALAVYNSGRPWSVSQKFGETSNYVRSILAGGLGGAQKPSKTKVTTFGTEGPKNSRNALLNYVMANNTEFAETGRIDPGKNLQAAMAALSASGMDGGALSGGPGIKIPLKELGGTIAGGKNLKGAALVKFMIGEAQKRGLHVSENPFVDTVDPVHVKGSAHYQVYPGTKIGKALDVSGGADALRRYFQFVSRYAGKGLNDLFYDPMGFSYDRGRRWNKTIGGHGEHVHASFY